MGTYLSWRVSTFVVDDVLHFSDDETPSVLIVKFVRLTRNCPDQIFSYAVVFPKPNAAKWYEWQSTAAVDSLDHHLSVILKWKTIWIDYELEIVHTIPIRDHKFANFVTYPLGKIRKKCCLRATFDVRCSRTSSSFLYLTSYLVIHLLFQLSCRTH